ncbi:MAG: N-acetylmuramic acid 6-phosphate etherase [Clostridia bacterium]|nr:N-acetylmuramic acid 6-phosphate etherase [Clostridia bacterium]
MLKTEMRNCASMHIDKMSTKDALCVIQNENKNAVNSIDAEIDNIAKAVDAIVERMKKGGRLFYVGCGTSGRLGVLDASECPPTYGVRNDLVIGIIAGGDTALRNAVEGAEDDSESGYRTLSGYGINENDSVIGISVAGEAGFVIGALNCAKEKNALCIALTCNKNSTLEKLSEITICPDTGAEVITGSTRMKAGSAHKMILNMISTEVMIQLGFVYENLMINLKNTNKKLRDRMVRIVCEITRLSYEESEKLLEKHGWSIKEAIKQQKI